jgi:hypothetical protein
MCRKRAKVIQNLKPFCKSERGIFAIRHTRLLFLTPKGPYIANINDEG